MNKLRRKIRIFAIHTRMFVIILQFVCNLVIPDHDAGAFKWNIDPKWEPTVADRIIGFFLDGLVRWDSQHFLHIANHGYTFESSLAFFPLFPLVVRSLASFLFWIQQDYMIVSLVSCIKVSATFINFACFVLAAEVLYELSRKVLKDEYIAYKAGLLFTVNPASIFFTASYSESLNALFTFLALNQMTKGFSAKTSIALAFASATRANSILNAGFVVFNSLKIVATESVLYVRLKKLAKPGVEVSVSTTIANILGDALIPGILNLISCLSPFVLYQWFCFTHFCRVTQNSPDVPSFVVDYGRNNLMKVVGDDPSSWCKEEPPVSYWFVQTNYWSNGFLQYWEIKQLPNFLLATPAIGLVLWHSYHFVLVHKDFCKRLGLIDNNLLGLPRKPVLAVRQHKVLPRECFVYVVHATALAIFGLFFINVQVVTRLLASSSPILPWLAALMTTRQDKQLVPIDEDNTEETLYKVECRGNMDSNTDTILFQEQLDGDSAQWVMMYFLGYTMIGTVLFSNHLPWT